MVAPAAASAAVVDTSAWYVLTAQHSGKALDVYDRATADGARIVQWARNDGAWQQWQFVDSGGGYYRLRSRHSGKVLDVHDSSTADGAERRPVGRPQRHQPAVPARRLRPTATSS